MKMPFVKTDFNIVLSYNIFDFYKASIKGQRIPLKKGLYNYLVKSSNEGWFSWEDWYREVIWYGNKRGNYIYNCTGLHT